MDCANSSCSACENKSIATQSAGVLPSVARPAEAIDVVCGMTVTADDAHYPFEHEGSTYWFCCPGCRYAFKKDPASFLQEASC